MTIEDLKKEKTTTTITTNNQQLIGTVYREGNKNKLFFKFKSMQ